MRVLLLGANGFIGSHLSERILETTDWEISALDIHDDKLRHVIDHPRFHFVEGDVTINKEWIEYHIKRCDVVLPLVAIATPATYVKKPLAVFELVFEANLEIIKKAVKYGTRIVFPSTSEVYGMCTDEVFDEDTSNFVLGPTPKQRWIYSSCKQLLDRVLWAHGVESGYPFTIFRPYNWVGPRLDSLRTAREGGSRVVTQFLGDILDGRPIQLVNGGLQRRCFLWVGDGIDCLMRILENPGGVCDRQIFNVGNPANEVTIRDLAERVRTICRRDSRLADRPIHLVDVDADVFYGQGYQDVSFRVPSIEKARQVLGWTPSTDLDTALARTIDGYLRDRDAGASVT